MAQRRMFAKTIIDSDAFLDMPQSTQNLYFHLSMRADDDGFINNPKKIGRMIGCNDDDLKMLLMKNFVIGFEAGIVVIKHWRIHNYIRGDRYQPTVYQDELKQLEIKENKAYTFKEDGGMTLGLPNDNHMTYQVDTQVRLGKDRLGKVSKDIVSGKAEPPPTRHKFGEYSNVLLTDVQLEKLKSEFSDWEKRIERLDEYIQSSGKKYKDHLATIRNWAKKDKTEKKDTPTETKYDYNSIEEKMRKKLWGE